MTIYLYRRQRFLTYRAEKQTVAETHHIWWGLGGLCIIFWLIQTDQDSLVSAPSFPSKCTATIINIWLKATCSRIHQLGIRFMSWIMHSFIVHSNGPELSPFMSHHFPCPNVLPSAMIDKHCQIWPLNGGNQWYPRNWPSRIEQHCVNLIQDIKWWFW